MNILEVTELMIPKRYAIAVVSMTKATAAPAPMRRFLAKSRVLLRFPPGSKSSPGTGSMTTPVNASSNSFQLSFTVPLAGSFIYTLSPLNPFSTTKWFMFQWMMHGKRPSAFRASGLIRYAPTLNPWCTAAR